MTSDKLAAKIKKLALEAGYVDCGIASAEPFTKFAEAVESRKEQFPEAASLYEPMLGRAFPAGKHPWARSIVVCVRWYGKYKIPEEISAGIGRNYLFDRRYSGCPENDMPERMKGGLEELGLRVRTGGVPDRWAAVRAGVARFGRNNFVYTKKHGSWINIKTWLVDRELPRDEPRYEPICPESCRLCIDECPSAALEEPFCMRMDRCVAYLTYHAPEPIEEGLWRRMGHWIYGCDQCQLVCPLNRGRWREKEKAEWLEKLAPYLSDEALAEMDEETYRCVVQPAFWYIPPDGVQRWRRNARRALENKNSGDSIRFFC